MSSSLEPPTPLLRVRQSVQRSRSNNEQTTTPPRDHLGATFTATIHERPNAAIDPSITTLPSGYTVLVTGAGQSIGRHIAIAFVKARATNIILIARTAADLDQVGCELEKIAEGTGSPVNVRTLSLDASKLATYKTLKRMIDREFDGRLDCLVNNAGSIGSKQGFNRLHLTDPEEHARVFELNYLGPMYAMQQLIPNLLGNRSTGRLIINITSISSHITSVSSPIAYGASKHALNRLSQQVGETYRNQGLVCIALHPGGVKSRSAEAVPEFMHMMLRDDVTLCGAVCVWFAARSRPWASGRYISAKWDVEELEAQEDDILGSDKLKFRMVV